MYVDSTSCCGVGDIDGTRSPKDPKTALVQICDTLTNYTGKGEDLVPNYAHYLFTQATIAKRSAKSLKGYGEKLEAYIKEHKLGSVVRTEKATENPNTGNYIVAFLWTPDLKALTEWYKKNRPKVGRYRSDWT